MSECSLLFHFPPIVPPVFYFLIGCMSILIISRALPFFSDTGTNVVIRKRGFKSSGYIPPARNRIYGYLLLGVAAMLLLVIFVEIRC